MTEKDFAALAIEQLGALRNHAYAFLALTHSPHADAWGGVIGDLTLARERLERVIREEDRNEPR